MSRGTSDSGSATDCSERLCEEPRHQVSSAGPPAFLHDILEALNASGCAYALIQGDRSFEEAPASDIDIAFGENPNQVILPIIRRLAAATGARLVQCLHYEIPHGYYYVLAVGTPPRFLHLDCLYDPLGINRYRLPTPFLLEGAKAEAGAKRASKARMALYLLMKRSIKGEASSEALDVLAGCFNDAPDTVWSDVRTWFGDGARPLVTRLLQTRTTAEVQSILMQLSFTAERRFRFRHPARYLLSLLMNLTRKARRFVRPTGFFVVVLGPDGTGKSTAAGLVISKLERAFRRTWRFHWRPGLLPKLGLAKPTDEPESTTSLPPQSSRYRGAISLARFAYYWLDFCAGYWLRVYPRKARSTLIVGERYFPDVLVNPARYGFAVPRWLMRLAARGVPSPDLIVLLTDEPGVIYARKPELSPSTLHAQLEAYRSEIQRRWGPAVAIPGMGGAQVVAGRVSDLILDACARRTSIRLARHESPKWHGFPSRGRARLWVGDNDTLSNALKLYHPYSKLGRLIKASLSVPVLQATHAWLHTRPDCETAERLDRIGDFIRQTLGGEQGRVSFWTGASGASDKLTAQVSSRDSILGYVKVRRLDADAGLLQQEAEMIAWMESKLSGIAVLPRMLAFKEMDQDRLLFLSAPAHPGKQRPLQADHHDTRFLSALAALSEEKITAVQAFEAMGFDTFVARVARNDASAAGILESSIEAVCNVLGPKRIKTAPCHGDYAPWNTLALPDGTLYVFDWEHARREAPLFADLFHRMLMPARLVVGETPRNVVSRLLDLHDDPVLGQVVSRSGIQGGDLPGYLLLYLAGMAMREEAEQGKIGEFVCEAIQHSLQRIDYPGRRRNVLVAAYACEPGGGSEPGVGWNMCQAISRENNAWVITRRNNRDAIERALVQAPNPYLHFHYADLPPWARFWKKGGRGIRTYYYLWQFAACIEGRRLTRRVPFDLAHQVTFVNDYIFSFLGLLPFSFVWGPLGSNPKLPASFAERDLKFLLLDRVRGLWRDLLRVVDPLFWLCAYRARLIIGIDARLGSKLPIALLAKRKFMVHTAIGVEDEDLARAPIPSHSAEDAIRILSVGRMDKFPVKGFHLALRAFAHLLRREPRARLELVGDGPARAALQKDATLLGIAPSVDFLGWLPRHEALSRFAHADIFLFPSAEGGGMVVLEAMAHGLPVVCLDYGGPGKMVGSDCGFAVEAGDTETMVASLGAALVTLTEDRSLRLRMGLAGARRVGERYSWRLRHKIIGQWYARALSNERPMVRQ